MYIKIYKRKLKNMRYNLSGHGISLSLSLPFIHTHTHVLQFYNHKQQTNQQNAHNQPTDGNGHFISRFQRESSFAARRASLIFRPRAFRAVVHVPAPLTHPKFAVHRGVRVRRDDFRRRFRTSFRFRHGDNLRATLLRFERNSRRLHLRRMKRKRNLLRQYPRTKVMLSFREKGKNPSHTLRARISEDLETALFKKNTR